MQDAILAVSDVEVEENNDDGRGESEVRIAMALADKQWLARVSTVFDGSSRSGSRMDGVVRYEDEIKVGVDDADFAEFADVISSCGVVPRLASLHPTEPLCA